MTLNPNATWKNPTAFLVRAHQKVMTILDVILKENKLLTSAPLNPTDRHAPTSCSDREWKQGMTRGDIASDACGAGEGSTGHVILNQPDQWTWWRGINASDKRTVRALTTIRV